MAEQVCPNCNKHSFTWMLDEDVSDLTIWGCYNCGYEAFEDESKERNCMKYGSKTESKLKDNIKEYWWCCKCNEVTLINRK